MFTLHTASIYMPKSFFKHGFYFFLVELQTRFEKGIQFKLYAKIHGSLKKESLEHDNL